MIENKSNNINLFVDMFKHNALQIQYEYGSAKS